MVNFKANYINNNITFKKDLIIPIKMKFLRLEKKAKSNYMLLTCEFELQDTVSLKVIT